MTEAVASEPPSGEPTRPELTRVLLDQQERWYRGTPRPIEAYLDEKPELRGNVSGMLLLIHNEVDLRFQKGDTPDQGDYLRRFPHLATQIRLLFEVTTILQEVPEKTWPVLPGYEIVSEMGRGGMGVVYRARQKGPLHRFVALKMVRDNDRAPGSARVSARRRRRWHTCSTRTSCRYTIMASRIVGCSLRWNWLKAAACPTRSVDCWWARLQQPNSWKPWRGPFTTPTSAASSIGI